MKGKVSAITGGGGGIGFAAAEAIAEAGGDVALLYRSAPNMEERSKKLGEKFGVKVKAYQCEVTEEESVAKAVKAVKADFGRLDCFIANAGGVSASSRRAREKLVVRRERGKLTTRATGSPRFDRRKLLGRVVEQDDERQPAFDLLRRKGVRSHLPRTRIRLLHRHDLHLCLNRQCTVPSSAIQRFESRSRTLHPLDRTRLAQLCPRELHLPWLLRHSYGSLR